MGVWNDSSDRALLLNVIDPATKPDWARVAEAMGEGFTAESCRQHFAKIKKVTPLAPASEAGATTPKSGKRKAKNADGTEETPTKKPRKPRTPKAKSAPAGAKDEVKEDVKEEMMAAATVKSETG
ncbi:hypothetical protein FQN55_001054 [Onygenales sp. PD_40]|nr:hypothetical protein FQN55_001054 [Onygenales sp. PD_40]KAK2780898.1 hypothetical protein FQN52_001995 [Onygenales sp. PD_12]KAK2789337.1 hypothetical protein FQN53_002179 [Emmonsiellopsis sp. PD_33]KAK2800731.1 hypothetical protein FQN51_005871 [Onygenales sp. PD_10]